MQGSRPTRVVRLLPTLDFGGVESRAVLQSQYMDRDEFDLRVCTFWKDGAAAAAIRAAGVPVDVLGVNPSIRNLGATRQLIRYLRGVRPDIVHASIGEANFHGAIASAVARVPFRIVEEVGLPSRGLATRLAFRAAYMAVDRVVGVSQATCDYLTQVQGIAAGKVRLVYNCANPLYFTGDAPHRRRGGGRPFRILAVGRLVPVKNHLRLLQAFADVVKSHEAAELHIVGEGPLRHELAAAISSLGLEDRVRLLGFQDDVRERLADADLFVLPSVSEGCSISLIEAMSTAVPVLGSTASGIREVMGELGSEYLVPHDDVGGWSRAMERIIGLAEADRARLGARARDVAFRRFSPRTYIGNVEALYREARG